MSAPVDAGDGFLIGLVFVFGIFIGLAVTVLGFLLMPISMRCF